MRVAETAQSVSRQVKETAGSMSWQAKLALALGGILVALAYVQWLSAYLVFPLIALAVALIASKEVRAALEPLADFGRILLPLLLPVIAAATVGAVALPLALQAVVIPLALLATWYGILRPRFPETKSALRKAMEWWERQPSLRLILLGFGALVAIYLLFRFALDVQPKEANPFQERPGPSSVVLAFAFIGWLFAIALRLIGYGTALFRLLAAIAAIALAWRGATLAGILPWHDAIDGHWWSEPKNLAIALGGLLLIVVAVQILSMNWQVAADWPNRGPLSEGVADFSAALGFIAVCAAALLLALGALAGALSAANYGNTDVADGIPPGQPQPGERPRSISLDPANDHLLAQQYSPVLQMTEGERWEPERADLYVDRATMIREDRRPSRTRSGEIRRQRRVIKFDLDPANLPVDCHSPLQNRPCYTLTIGHQEHLGDANGKLVWRSCDDGESPCAGGRDYDSGEVVDGPAYVRVLREGREEADLSTDAFGQVKRYFHRGNPYFPKGQRPTTLIQYWFFYPYDEWTRPVLTGTLTQFHEGDWEAVTVGLSDVGPMFVAYSAHCGSTAIQWSKIKVAPDEDSDLHPLVAVAEGSHANYPRAEQRRAPDWAACAKGPEGVTKLLSYASNIRDETDVDSGGWTWRPTELILVNENTPPMSFPGTWGFDDVTELENQRSQTLHQGDGPRTPSLQGLWQDPLEKIFCSKNSSPRTC